MPSYYQTTHSISVKVPMEKVYEALTDWSLRSQWRRGIEITWEGGAKAFAGQRVTFRVKRPLLSYSFAFLVTGLEPPRRFYLEYLGRPLQGRAAVEINPEDTGCQVAFHWMKVEPAGLAAWLYFALGLGMKAHRVRTLETLRMLKEYLEKGSVA